VLRTEAIRFSRYLIGADPTEELVARYCEANAILFVDPPSAADRALLEFAHAHPWSIPLFDASTGVSSGSRFRKKLLVMMAILETTPRFVDRTSPRSVGFGHITLRVGATGVVMVAKLAAGLALSFVLARRARHDARETPASRQASKYPRGEQA
jgi:hypothetical protein